MRTENFVFLAGLVGKDPEVMATRQGKLAKFTLATKETWKDAEGEWKEVTDWHNIVCFGGVADKVADFIKKGDRVSIRGQIKNKNYVDKDGNKRFATDIRAEHVTQMIAKSDVPNTGYKNKQAENNPEPSNDDAPF